MKDWLARMRETKGAAWMLLALCLGVALCMMNLGSAGESTAMTAEEKRLSATLSCIAGAGETRVSIYYAKESAAFGNGAETPVGAVIVSRGADQIRVRLDLMRAAEALLGLGEGSVEVFVMEDTACGKE